MEVGSIVGSGVGGSAGGEVCAKMRENWRWEDGFGGVGGSFTFRSSVLIPSHSWAWLAVASPTSELELLASKIS